MLLLIPTLPKMQEEVGEELLITLGLSINSSWSRDVSKKRKRQKDHDHHDNEFYGLLRTRDEMLSQGPNRDIKGVQLIRLLLVSATAVNTNNVSTAVKSLTELYRNTSVSGDPIQRVTSYFIDGLTAALFTRSSPFYERLIAYPTPEAEFSAFTELYRASPYYQFAHFTANQAIIEAFEEEEEQNERSLHVIDFDISYGFQWPSLIQSLSDKATSAKPISLRVTGLGDSLEKLRETEMRLTGFAKGCRNVFFEFEGILRGNYNYNSAHKIKKSETLVVNLVFYLQSLRSSAEIRDTMKDIRNLNPSVVVLVEKEGSRAPRSFLSRFMESLHYFAAMFDSLDDCLPSDSTERLCIEKNHLGREIKNAVISCGEKEEPSPKSETMEENRFEEVKLSSRSVSQAKLLLKIKCSTTEHGSSGGFRVFEKDNGRGLSLGWQDRNLVTVSAWRCAQ